MVRLEDPTGGKKEHHENLVIFGSQGLHRSFPAPELHDVYFSSVPFT